MTQKEIDELLESNNVALNDWERWITEVLVDYKIPFDDHTVGKRMALTLWMIDRNKDRVDNIALKDGLLSAIKELEMISVKEVKELIRTLCACPCCDGKGKWIPECQACLSGEPSKCTCKEQEEEDCGVCHQEGVYICSLHGQEALNRFISQYGDLEE